MTDIEVETTDLTAHEFRAEIPCEHPAHNQEKDPRTSLRNGHFGETAEWDYRYACPCGETARRMVCEGFRAFAIIRGGILCNACRISHPWTSVATFTRIPESR